MNLRKLAISIFFIILIFFSFEKTVNASIFTAGQEESKIESTINKDEGGLFEKIIAKIIGGLAETVFNITTKEEFGVGFKNYDELIFGNKQTDLSPFTNDMWNLIMKWYWKMAGIIGGPILIAIVILSWKMIIAGISPDKRAEVKDNVMRLFLGASAIVLAPIFVKLMLLINNSMVKMLVSNVHGSLDDILGNSILSNINTGNAIATALVIAMFAYLFVKINIKFIIREFTIIVFTVFTPIVAVFWIINRRTIAASIWFGQIIINSFMQFIFTFLFLIYMTFLPASSGWATSLLWAMMILPLGDSLQNTMQNLVSRIAGVNNEELSNRGIGMSSAIGYTVKTIAYQFKGSNTEGSLKKDLISKVIKKGITNNVSPMTSTNYENQSVNIMQNSKPMNQTNIMNREENNNTNTTLNDERINNVNSREQNTKTPVNGMKKAFNLGKEYMNFGMYMAEGKNFRNNVSKEFGKQNTKDFTQEEKEENNTKTKIIMEELEDDEYE